MGQRHQVFVIARIRPHGVATPEYRCIAVIHDQHCQGVQATQGIRRFLALVREKANAEIVLAEIKGMQGLYGRPNDLPAMPKTPAPFIVFLLAAAWSLSLEPGDTPLPGTVYILDANMGTADGDNNTGITILDITDPYAPAYCLNWICSSPVSAEEYLCQQYDIEDPTDPAVIDLGVFTCIEELQDVPLVTIDMLAQAWPSEYDELLAAHTKPQKEPEDIVVSDVHTASLPSLAEMALKAALSQCLRSGDTEYLESLMWREDMRSVALPILRQLSPFPDSGVGLLKMIIPTLISQDAVLDLSGYCLRSHQVSPVLPTKASIQSLNLSNNVDLKIDAVAEILRTIPRLRRLVLFCCQGISNEEVYKLLANEPALFHHLEAFMHPALLTIAEDERDECPYKSAFSYISCYSRCTAACALPYFSPIAIVEALTVFLARNAQKYRPAVPGSFIHTPQAYKTMFSAAPLKPGQTWDNRSLVVTPRWSVKALVGEGWAFCLDGHERYYAARREPYSGYGFVRFAPGENVPRTSSDADLQEDRELGTAQVLQADEEDEGKDVNKDDQKRCLPEILDLRPFLKQMESQGRPVPTEAAIEKLEIILRKTVDGRSSFQLFDQETLDAFLNRASSNESNRRYIY
ncbi:hypothetical protein BV25DRAFT_1862754 [Artomyces pyxidatus]|uniref:Uncharacterized protein n=1 Tax=Artomyces pyxidatus TaxID=48021 RepID=A0ACB8SN30_9AGAM|nr:hypothetical protein BV25DRAFT_1862754 [Artomyces pyxidatus]